MADIPIGSRWRDREAGGRVAVVGAVVKGRVRFWYEDDETGAPWYCDVTGFTLWGRFERVEAEGVPDAR